MSEELKEFVNLESDYCEVIPDYEVAMTITKAKIKNAAKSLKKNWGYELEDDSIKSRLKSFDSVITKWNRKQYPGDTTIQNIRKYITDIAGIRIITDLEDEIYDIVAVLRKVPSINIIEENDYIANPKKSGYRSYHMIVLVEIWSSVTEESKLVPVEIQIRDCTMDAWSRIEHKLKYKISSNSQNEDFFTESAEDLSVFRKKAIAKKNELKNPAN